MSKEQSFLSPAQQDKLFQAMKDAGLLSQDVGQSTDNQDTSAQTGVGNLDFDTLQSLIKHSANPNAVPMQEGDQVHPMDAISQIGSKMFGPQAPGGVSLATGPKIQANSQGGLTTEIPSDNFLLRKLGLSQKIPVNTPNYFEAAKQAGIDKFLPSGLAQMPDGTPFVGPETFTKALTAQRTAQNPNNPPISLSDAVDLGIITQKQYQAQIDKGVDPTSVKPATVWRLATAGRLAGAREGLVALGNNKLEQSMIGDLVDNISDATTKGPAAIQANTLNWAIHGRQIASGAYNPDTQTYDLKPQQIAEMTLDLNRIMTGSSNVAESAREDISAATAKGDLAKLAQYAGVNDFNGTTQDLAKMYISMLDRQGSTSNDLLNATLARQIPRAQVLQKINPSAYQAVLNNSFGTNDYRQFLQSLPDASQTIIPPQVQLGGRGVVPPKPQATGVWKVIR